MALMVEKTTQVVTNTRSMTFPRATSMLLLHLLHPRPRRNHYCIEHALDWGLDGGPNLIVDDDGHTTFLIHEGIKIEELYEKTDELLDPNSTDNVEFQIVLTIIRDGLYQMQLNGTFLFPTINVNDFVTNNKVMSLFPPDLVPFCVKMKWGFEPVNCLTNMTDYDEYGTPVDRETFMKELETFYKSHSIVLSTYNIPCDAFMEFKPLKFYTIVVLLVVFIYSRATQTIADTSCRL
ncbi:hypothetical protein JHK82_033952 [Glycine max]|nr:hypothetical protein JHK85_034659 [Glycine max]KAG4986338.1 hypothetical protein JHK86_034029 [Glycine max]KAG5119532.1 hypothetical protein JHK82_033952 [Glycine max]KAG5140518.1 hypothetical protein JHK84_034286 [Glycine max]